MRKALFAGALAVAAVAFAGQAGRDGTVSSPSNSVPATSVGVTLNGAVGCRCSIRVPDAGSNVIGADGLAAAGYIVPWYKDDSLPVWVESVSAQHCAIAAKLDAGRIRFQVCPDLVPAARFGRVYCSGYGITGYDGGSGQDWIADGGVGPAVVVRTECWGPSMSSTP